MNDGYNINFNECRTNWVNSRKINCSDTVCVADRFLSDDEAYFLFYTNDRVKIVFKKAFFIWKSKRRKKFMEIQMRLNNFGYSSFDCS